jgi:hypothetical protein
MLCWICPECGRESPPAVRDCPACVGATAEASVPESLKQQLEMTAGILALARTFQEEPTVRLLASAPRPMLLAAASANGSSEDAVSSVQIAVAEPIVVDSMETVVRGLVESASTGTPQGFDPGPIPGAPNGFHSIAALHDEVQEPVPPVRADSADLASDPGSDAFPVPSDGPRVQTSSSAATSPPEPLAPTLSDHADHDASTVELANSAPTAKAPDATTTANTAPTESIPDPADLNASVVELTNSVPEEAAPNPITATNSTPAESIPSALADPADLNTSVVELVSTVPGVVAPDAATTTNTAPTESIPDPADLNASAVELANSVPEATNSTPLESIPTALSDPADHCATVVEVGVPEAPTDSIAPAWADTELNASVAELAGCVAEVQTGDLAPPPNPEPPPAPVLADPADLDASIVELAGCVAEIQATEPPPPVELEPELIALANALEFHAIFQLDAIYQQLQADNSCIRAIVESFFEQPKTPLLSWPESIVQPPAPMASQRIPMPRPNIAPAQPPPADPVASLSPQPLTLAGPYLPRELQSFVPSPPRAAKGARQGGRIPGWIVSSVVALLLFLGAGTVLQYFTGNGDAKASSVPVSQASSADAALDVAPGETHPLARFVEVTGLRVVADLKHRSQLHYIVVNHGSTQLAGVSLRIAVRSSVTGANDPPLFAVATVIPSLGAYQSKEFRVDLDGDVRSSVIPEWQNLRADFQVATHQ